MTTSQTTRVTAQQLSSVAAAQLGPAGTAWAAIEERVIALQPTPLDRQPSAYVRASWEGKAYGSLSAAGLSAAVFESSLFLRLRWLAPEPRLSITDNDVFADAAAVLFPMDGVGAELSTMGDEQRPVQAWHWRAGADGAFVVTARGLGTATRVPRHSVEATAEWDHGQWSVVLSRPLSGEGVPLVPGASVPCGVALWCGARGERAGLKSHTPGWVTLTLPK